MRWNICIDRLICLTRKKQTYPANTHLFQSFASYCGYLLTGRSKLVYAEHVKMGHGLPVYLFDCATYPSWFFERSFDHLSASGNRDNPLVEGNTVAAPVSKEGYFFPVKQISGCYLAPRHPPILLNNISHKLRKNNVLICDPDWQAQVICASVLDWVTAWLRDLAAVS